MSLTMKFQLKIRVKRKRNFIIYHFVVKRKPYERIDQLITTSVNIYQTKKNPKVMHTCFSEGKLMKQLGNPFLSKRSPLSTKLPISEQFFQDPPLCPNFKNKTPSPLNLRGEETMYYVYIYIYKVAFNSLMIHNNLSFLYILLGEFQLKFQIKIFKRIM